MNSYPYFRQTHPAIKLKIGRKYFMQILVLGLFPKFLLYATIPTALLNCYSRKKVGIDLIWCYKEYNNWYENYVVTYEASIHSCNCYDSFVLITTLVQ